MLCVRNLGFILVSSYSEFTCLQEIKLRRLASTRRFLTSTATVTLVSAFVLPRIDYCKSLLFGSTYDVSSHFERIQNYM